MRMKWPVRVVIVLLALGCAGLVSADNWPRFQGPIPAGVEAKSLPLKWSPQEKFVWTRDIDGYGQSSPVVWGERVFVTAVSGKNKDRGHVTAMDAASGKELWKFDFDTASGEESSNYVSKAAPTPVVDEQGIVCFFEGGDLLSLSNDGKVRWRRNLVKEFGELKSRHGLASSLEQSGDRVFVWVERSEEPYVLAIDKQTGKDLWKAPGLGVTSWASPRLVPVGKSQHLVLSGIGVLAGLDPANGKELWRFTGISSNSTPTPQPVGDSRFLIGATAGRGEGAGGNAAASNGLVEIKQAADGGFSADFVWKAKRATCSFGSPIAHRGLAYYVNATGVLFCLDLKTGEEKYAERIAESNWATPIALEDRIYFFGKSGKVSVVAAGPEFKRLAENETWVDAAPAAAPAGGPSFGGPVLYAAVIADNKFILRRGDKLYCVAGP